MANTVIGASVQVDFQSVGNMRKALKEANQELIAMQEQFGVTSDEAIKAAQKVAEIKDKIDDAREAADLFDPGKKFQAFATLGSQIAAGFSAVQGAMALVGSESEDVQKALLKVQSAMALAQGLSQLKDIGKSWQQMRIFINSATKGLSGFQKALLATGVGILVAIVAYWEDISKAIGLASTESENFKEVQEKSNSALADAKMKVAEVTSAFEGYRKGIISKEKALKIYNETLGDSLGKTNDINVAEQRMIANTENYLKSVQLKAKAQAAFAKSAELSVQLEADIEKGARESGLTVEEYRKQIDSLGKEFDTNFLGKAQQEIDDLNKIANDAFLEATSLTEKINAENLNKQFEDNQKANEKKLKDNKDYEDKQIELRKKAADLQIQLTADVLKNNLDAQGKELFDLSTKYNEQKKILEQGGQDTALLTSLYEKQRQEIIEKFAKEEKKKREEVENELNKISEEIRLLGIKDIREKERAELAIGYADQLREIETNENYNAEQKAQFRAALLTKQKLEEDALNKKFREEDLQKQSSQLLADAGSDEFNLKQRLEFVKQREELENQIVFENEDARTAYQKQNADAREKIAKAEAENRMMIAENFINVLAQLESITGKNTKQSFERSKKLQIAQALISTYLAINRTLAAFSGMPIPGYAIAQAIATGVAGFIQVKKIAETKFESPEVTAPKVSGGATGTMAPIEPALSPAVQGQAMNADAINNLGNTAFRAYVMNSDIQNNNQRNAYLQRNARIG